MDEFEHVSDEELIFQLALGNIGVSYTLIERCRKYASFVAPEVRKLYTLAYYDENLINEAVMEAFKNACANYIVRKARFKTFYIKCFEFAYRSKLQAQSNQLYNERSLEEEFDDISGLVFKEVLVDNEAIDPVGFTNDRYVNKVMASLTQEHFKSYKKAMVFQDKIDGYTLKDIAKRNKLSIKQVRIILEDEKFQKKLIDKLDIEKEKK